MRKFFICFVALLAIAAAATEPARAQSNTVTWTNYNMPEFDLSSQGDRQTTDDVTITSNGGSAGDNDGNIYFNGAFTFSVPVGSVLTQIVIRDDTWLGVDVNNTGWSVDEHQTQATWTGSARSVACQINASHVQYFEFTIASAVPKMYTSEVSITDLVPGDTLAEGATIIGSGDDDDMVYLNAGRAKANGVVQSFWTNLFLPPTVIGTNGTISGTYTPVDGNGQDGNAWVVTDAEINYFDGFQVGLSGIFIPVYRTLDSIPADWTVKVAGVTQTLQTYDGGNPNMRWLEIPETGIVKLLPPATDKPNVKALTVKEASAEPVLLTTIMSNANTTFTNGSMTFDNIATVTFSGEVSNSGDWGWYHTNGTTLTVTPAEGITITRVKFTNADGSAYDETVPFEAVLGDGDPWNNPYMFVNGNEYGYYGVTKIEVYGYQDLEATRDADSNWTFAMPNNDALVSITYKDSAHLAWTYNSAAMPAEGLTAYRGFELPVIGGIGASMDHDFLTALLGGTVSLRYGSTNPAVISFTDANDIQSFSVNGAGECDVYMVFNGNDDYQRDSVAFHAVIADPATLTLDANNSEWGSVTIPTGLVATDPTPAPTPTALANPVITCVLMPDGSMQVTMSCTSPNTDIYYTTDNVTSPLCDCPAAPEYTQPITFTEPVTLKAAAYDGNNWSAVVTKTISLGYPEGIMANTANTYRVLPGTEVNVIATPAEGNYLQSWTPDSTVHNILSDTLSFTMPEAGANITATFAQNPLLTLEAQGNGTVTLGGVTEASPATYTIQFSANGNTVTRENVTLPKTYACSYDNGNGELDQIIQGLYGYGYVGGECGDQAPTSSNINIATGMNGDNQYITFNGPFEGTATVSGAYTLEDEYAFTYNIYYNLTITVSPNSFVTLPEGVTYVDANTYRVLPGTEVKVIATPTDSTYFVNWTDSAAVNSNIGDTNTLTMGTAAVELTANFAAKPVLTLAQNESDWGSVTIPTGLVATDPTPAPTPTALANPVITGVLMPDGSMQVTMSCTSPNTDIYYTTDNVTSPLCDCPAAPEYTHPITFTEPVTLKAAAYDGNNWSAVVTKTISLGYPEGIMANTDGTYTVNYGQTVTLNAEAAELHHVAGWQNESGTAMNTATYSDYFITTPENLFPAKSALTFTMTQDTTARALFGINSYDVFATAELDSRAEIGTDTSMGYIAVSFIDIVGDAQTVDPADSVTITAQGGSASVFTVTPHYGYLFTGWYDADEDTLMSAFTTLTLTEAYEVEARFVPDTFEVSTFTATPADTLASAGTVTGADRYAYRTLVTLEETPATGYHFVNWSNTARTALGTETTVTVQLMQDTAIFAVMDTNVYNITYTIQTDDRDEIGTGLPMGTVVLEGRHMHFLNDVLTATAAYGYVFAGWYSNNELVSTANPYTFSPVSDSAFEARFVPDTFSFATATNNFRWGTVEADEDGRYPYLSQMTLEAVPTIGNHFVEWSDGDTNIVRTISLTQDTLMTATFARTYYTVTYNPSEEGRGTISCEHPNPFQSNYGYTTHMKATAEYGYHFVRWQNAAGTSVLGLQDSIDIVVTKDTAIVAVFELNNYTITAQSESAAKGSVTGSGNYLYLSEATLTATAKNGYHFTQWNDGDTLNPRTVEVLANATYTAQFAKNLYTVTVVSADTAMGSAAGTATVNYLDTVQISATANAHYHFAQWQDGNKQNPRNYTVTGDATMTAQFAPDQYIVKGVADQGRGSVTGSGTYDYLTNVMLTAVPTCGFVFDHWSDNSTDGTITVTATEDMILTAYFRAVAVDTVEVHDTIEYHDTTVVALDTIFVPVPDTTLVPVTLYDTTTVDVTVYDTTVVDITIYDTTSVPIQVFDTVVVPVTIVDTTLAPVVVYDTTTIDVTLYDTTNVAVTVYDTTSVPVTLYDTTNVPVTVYDTTTVPVTVYDTTVTTVPVTVYDTTTVPVTVIDTTIVPVTEYDTTHVAVIVVDSTLVPVYDTIWLTQYLHDTVYIEVHDTVYIHDTIFVGIDEVDALDAKIYASNGQIVVEGAEGNQVVLYDVTGRVLAIKRDEYSVLRFDIPASGTYLVKIGNHPARRIVMIR